MRLSVFLIMSCLTYALVGCAETGRYPITDVECDPDNPVLNAPDCTPI